MTEEATMTTMNVLELDPADLGTLEVEDGVWVPYLDLYGEVPYVPTHVRLGTDEYVYDSSTIVFGHGAAMPQKIRELRGAGKKILVLQRGSSGSGGKNDRYLIFTAPGGGAGG